MSNLAIIPARGGSKRINKKNIKDFLGKPIIAYPIETVLKSDLFSEVMVSTDDEEIAEVAKYYGANIPFIRSEKNADDFASLADVVNEVIAKYEGMGQHFEYACCILPTSPLMTIENLIKGFSILKNSTLDSIRPVVKFGYPIQRAFKMNAKNGKINFIYPENAKSRSQDLDPAFHDAGQFYWFKTDKGMSTENKGAFEITELESQDIDNLDDWHMAELKYNLLFNK